MHELNLIRYKMKKIILLNQSNYMQNNSENNLKTRADTPYTQ